MEFLLLRNYVSSILVLVKVSDNSELTETKMKFNQQFLV